jgi:hypothetical protein
VEPIRSRDQLTQDNVVDVKNANGQDTNQTYKELNVFLDHLPNAIVSKRTQLMDMIANHAKTE